MDEPSSNDNGSTSPEPDPNGEAALLLVESLIHGLIARGVISVVDAVEIVDIAAEVKTELSIERKGELDGAGPSIARLRSISTSLRHDLTRE